MILVKCNCNGIACHIYYYLYDEIQYKIVYFRRLEIIPPGYEILEKYEANL